MNMWYIKASVLRSSDFVHVDIPFMQVNNGLKYSKSSSKNKILKPFELLHYRSSFSSLCENYGWTFLFLLQFMKLELQKRALEPLLLLTRSVSPRVVWEITKIQAASNKKAKIEFFYVYQNKFDIVARLRVKK
jgi:hypothetical protein